MSSPETASPLSFEQALARLEGTVRRLEEGELGLADALAQYEEGVRLLRQCHGMLQHAERKIELLTGVDAQGRPVTQPFADEAPAPLEERSAARSRRRTAVRNPDGPSPDPTPDAMDGPGRLF